MDDAEIAALRSALVDNLKAEGYVNTDAVEAALRDVPRHLFIPWRKPEDAYRRTEGAIADPDTTPETCSTVSQPIAVAMMLEAFDVKPGMRVLEIGAGSGYNAALLAHLAGKNGRVVTVDLEDLLVAKARKQLAATGFGHVEVVCGDGALGYPPGAPYDRIVATVGLPDIPPAWLEQLAPGGKVAVPLHVGGEPRGPCAGQPRGQGRVSRGRRFGQLGDGAVSQSDGALQRRDYPPAGCGVARGRDRRTQDHYLSRSCGRTARAATAAPQKTRAV